MYFPNAWTVEVPILRALEGLGTSTAMFDDPKLPKGTVGDNHCVVWEQKNAYKMDGRERMVSGAPCILDLDENQEDSTNIPSV
jgi:hypothetical protein